LTKTFAFIWLKGRECQAGGYFTEACEGASSFLFSVSFEPFPSALPANEKLTAFIELGSAIWQRVKDWEIIADKLSKAGWSWGWVSAVDPQGRTIWIVDAHRGDGRRFIVRSDEKLSAFVELERQVLTVTFYLESIQ